MRRFNETQEEVEMQYHKLPNLGRPKTRNLVPDGSWYCFLLELIKRIGHFRRGLEH
jgi:hypothetical protein